MTPIMLNLFVGPMLEIPSSVRFIYIIISTQILTFLSTVLDRERFEEVLGRWFKHRHFSAFVCQLKLYGFYKIPHSQQGGLKSDTETEIWNFAHANFHRGQPDLLCLIKRKKQAPQYGHEASIDLPGGMTFGGWPSC